ncbi:arrestin [Schizosaccharomyces japonicus yFS275]|uniref:Arrestin n=1 Tax=Schizosaccharomyces japonicus (strain yFS275 / FY16936) TaxID=402676 RepID=B6K5S5_SCHJY|nr:arrestin [Schizosaccharomyces japonicus yFS275]EEB08879.1 arrestin [Schizosaccharomyces japonicus yFS275]
MVLDNRVNVSYEAESSNRNSTFRRRLFNKISLKKSAKRKDTANTKLPDENCLTNCDTHYQVPHLKLRLWEPRTAEDTYNAMSKMKPHLSRKQAYLDSLLKVPEQTDDHVRLSLTVTQKPLKNGELVHGYISFSLSASVPFFLQAINLDFYGQAQLHKEKSFIFLSCSQNFIRSNDANLPVELLEYAQNITEHGVYMKTPCNVNIPFTFKIPEEVGPGTFQYNVVNISYAFSASLVWTQLGDKEHFVRLTYPKRVVPRVDSDIVCASNTIVCEAPESSSEKRRLTLIRASIPRSVFTCAQSVPVTVYINNSCHQKVHHLKVELLETVAISTTTKAPKNYSEERNGNVSQTLKTKTLSSVTIHCGHDNQVLIKETGTCFSLEIPFHCRSIEFKNRFALAYSLKITARTRLRQRLASVRFPLTILGEPVEEADFNTESENPMISDPPTL